MNIVDNRKILNRLKEDCDQYNLIIEVYDILKRILLPGDFSIIINYHDARWGVCLISVLYVEPTHDGKFRVVGATFPEQPNQRYWDEQHDVLIPMCDPNCFERLSEEMFKIIKKVRIKFPRYANGDTTDKKDAWKAPPA